MHFPKAATWLQSLPEYYQQNLVRICLPMCTLIFLNTTTTNCKFKTAWLYCGHLVWWSYFRSVPSRKQPQQSSINVSCTLLNLLTCWNWLDIVLSALYIHEMVFSIKTLIPNVIITLILSFMVRPIATCTTALGLPNLNYIIIGTE